MKHQRTLSVYTLSMLASLFCSSAMISGQDNPKDIVVDHTSQKPSSN